MHAMTTRTRRTSGLAFGSVVSGLLAYLFFALVTRALGSTSAAPVSVLWAYWSFASAALTFPLQHWVARSVAAHGGERPVREALPGVALLGAGLAVVATTVCWLAREPLFRSEQAWFPLLVGAVTLGSAVLGVVRGVLTARGRFGAVGLGLVAENGIRCLAAVVLMAVGVRDPAAYGLCLLAGYTVAVVWVSTFRLSRVGSPGGGESPLAFLGGAGGGQVTGQGVLTGGPVVLALAGGSAPQITALFAGLALFRAPYTLALGLVAPLTGRFTRLVVQRRDDDLRRLRRLLVALTATGVSGAALVGYLAGPWLLSLVFGADVSLAPLLCLVLAVGNTLAMANLVATLIVLAHDRALALVRAWALALLPGVAWFGLVEGAALERTCGAFLVVEAAAWLLLLREEVRGTARLSG